MRVYLRALEIDDYIYFNKWRNDPDIINGLSGNFYFVSSEREKKSVESKILDDSKNLYLSICEKETNNLIGYVSINNIDLRNMKTEWGGTLIGDKNYLGKGYGKEASAIMLRFLFNEYPINRCYAYCLEEHPRTKKLFEELGFKLEGVLRENLYKSGMFKNVMLYSILRKEINDNF